MFIYAKYLAWSEYGKINVLSVFHHAVISNQKSLYGLSGVVYVDKSYLFIKITESNIPSGVTSVRLLKGVAWPTENEDKPEVFCIRQVGMIFIKYFLVSKLTVFTKILNLEMRLRGGCELFHQINQWSGWPEKVKHI